MRITKHPQSCLIIEGEGRICVDLGSLVTATTNIEQLGHLDAVLFTHTHPDHLDPEAADRLLDADVPLYGNTDVCSLLGERAGELRDGESLEVAGFEILPVDVPHVPLVDGSPGPPNTGFVVDGRLFHPGDSITDPGLTAEILAVPIAGPSISNRDAYRLAEAVDAATVIPIHYDYFVANPQLFANNVDIAKVVVLEHGQSVDL